MEKDPLLGTQLDDYYVQVKLGEGGMARVYRAHHARLKRDVAIKVILPYFADQPGFRARFEREAQLIASLEHRNIVAVYDFRDNRGAVAAANHFTYLVMQYVGGGTLRDLLRRHGHIEAHRAVHYALQMARALHHAHRRGIVHRDVKPQNMLISAGDSGELLLSDFGIAKAFEQGSLQPMPDRASLDPTVTSFGQLVGTAEYMAPEQISRQVVDARSDVYSLGIVLFQMLTGEVPFSSTTVQGLLYQHVYAPPRLVREINPAVPAALEQIISRALAKAPEHRYQSAEALALALESLSTPTTHELAGPLSGNFTTFVTPSHTPLHYLAGDRTAPTALSGARHATSYAQSTAVPDDSRGAGTEQAHDQRRPRYRLSTIMYSAACLLALALLLDKFALPWTCNTYGLLCAGGRGQVAPSTGGSAFTGDDFHHGNRYNWTTGYLDGNNLDAQIIDNQYRLNVGGNAGDSSKTYFPHPQTGELPASFILVAHIEQTAGDAGIFYGLAFRLQGTDALPTSYAFFLNGRGQYQLVKYVAARQTLLTQGSVSGPFVKGIDHPHTLAVTVQGATFSLQVDDGLQLNGTQQRLQRITDAASPLSGGQPGIVVAGPATTFVVAALTLTTRQAVSHARERAL